MHIGAVAKAVGLSPDAIRFYERAALLPHPPRSAGGYRLYSRGELESLAFIRQMQSLGFTLAEIREFLALRAEAAQPCAPVRRRLHRKLLGVRAKLADLNRLERELASALRACDRVLRRHARRCPLLRSVESRRRGKTAGK